MKVFNNHSPKFWTWLICLSFACIVVLAAAITNSLRNHQFQTQYDNIHHKDLQAIAIAQAELTQQALTTAHLIKENQLVIKLMAEAAQLYHHKAEAAGLEQMREQLQSVIQPYWLYLEQQGVKQLQFYLAPNAYTLYRAHRPEFHSDILLEARPLVMTAISSGQEVNGMEVGPHGVGLQAVLPVIINDKTVAAIEVGYGLAGALALSHKSPDNNTDAGMALGYSKDVLDVVSDDFRAQFNVDKAPPGSRKMVF